MKRTIVVAGGTAGAALRLEAARHGWHGVEIRSIEQVAARLAGGFLQPIDGDVLGNAAAEAIAALPAEELGDLGDIADLPGLPMALASTLSKVWHAGIELSPRARLRPDVPRLATLARLEAAVIERLPHAMLTPTALARRAIDRVAHAPRILGPIECRFLPDLAPCWRPLVIALSQVGSVTWNAGPRPAPAWVQAAGLNTTIASATRPDLRVVTCATARHEVIEALRWARSLLAKGAVRAQDIAFAAASPGEYDDLMLAMSEDANLDIHFAHGRRALLTRDGQAAAALADILLNGLSQDRVHRLARLAHDPSTPFGQLPEDWARDFPRAAPLASPERWRQAATAADVPETITAILFPAIDLLAAGAAQAAEAAEIFLRGQARLLFRRALARAPASALEASLSSLRMPDDVEPGSAIGWMHASALASAPRPYVWLLGLNARTWPRGSSEDPLLPDHVIPSSELEPLPVTRADRAAFHAIRATTTTTLVCCASRRDATGRLLGLSPLMPDGIPTDRLRRARVPEHAMSEQDRLMARPGEFAGTARAQSALACWEDWHNPQPTAHDGLVRDAHPVLERALHRVHSATSLKALLRNPLGFTWRYALGWREPDLAQEAMDLDGLQFGGLVHAILDLALPAIEAAGGLGRAPGSAMASAVAAARRSVAAQWEAEQAVPPAILWTLRLDEAEAMARAALAWPLSSYPGQLSQGEIPFGDPEAARPGLPWDASQAVTIPRTGLAIRGRIDRLDLSADGAQARVIDYKTGKPRDPGILDGGGELQRCLYAYAVQALLGPHVAVEAALLYPRGEQAAYYPLQDTGAALQTLTDALNAAAENLRAGRALPGPDTGSDWDDLAFALPAGPGALIDRKREAAKTMLGDAALIWEQA
jgi:hypothetical protein